MSYYNFVDFGEKDLKISQFTPTTTNGPIKIHPCYSMIFSSHSFLFQKNTCKEDTKLVYNFQSFHLTSNKMKRKRRESNSIVNFLSEILYKENTISEN